MIATICIEDVLIESAKEVFQTMVFMDIEKTSEPGPTITGNALLSLLTFDGKLQGCIGLCCDESCAVEIASNMLGCQPQGGFTDDQVHDAFGEIINVIMGKVELRLRETYGLLRASIPCVTTGMELKNNLGNNAQRFSIYLNLQDMHILSLSLICRENQ